MERELIVEILEELRITQEALEVMAQGYSPNKIGAIDAAVGKKFPFRYPVATLSQKLSKKLAGLGLPWKY